jgi:hypothetical protein
MVLRALRLTVLALAVAATMAGAWPAGLVSAAEIAPIPDPAASAAPAQVAAGPVAPGPVVAMPLATNLFYNYYVQGASGAVPAQLYLSPRPTPPLVGHTYFTYQPLMPNEFLYRHHRVYDRYDPDGGWTATKVHWGRLPGLPTVFSKFERPY